MTDIRAQLAQIRSILDDIDRDLPPKALKEQEDYDTITMIVGCVCLAGHCDECAFDIPGETCPLPKIQEMLAKARGGRSQ